MLKAILQITLAYRKQPLAKSSDSNQAPDHICMSCQYGQHISQSLGTSSFPTIAKEEACTYLQSDAALPTAYRCSWDVHSAMQHWQWIPESKLQKPVHMWKLCLVKLFIAF